MPSVLNPINIIPTIVRQPIPVLLLLELILSTALSAPRRSPGPLFYTTATLNVFLYPRAASRYFHTPNPEHLARS